MWPAREQKRSTANLGAGIRGELALAGLGSVPIAGGRRGLGSHWRSSRQPSRRRSSRCRSSRSWRPCSAVALVPVARPRARHATSGGEPRCVARRGRPPRRLRAGRHVASRERVGALAELGPAATRSAFAAFERDYRRTGNFSACLDRLKADAGRSRRRPHPRDPAHGARGRRQRRHGRAPRASPGTSAKTRRCGPRSSPGSHGSATRHGWASLRRGCCCSCSPADARPWSRTTRPPVPR